TADPPRDKEVWADARFHRSQPDLAQRHATRRHFRVGKPAVAAHGHDQLGQRLREPAASLALDIAQRRGWIDTRMLAQRPGKAIRHALLTQPACGADARL